MDHDLVQQPQLRCQLSKDPYRKIFTSRIFQARDLIQAVMIDLLEDWRKRLLDLGKIHYPAEMRIDITPHMHLNAKRMPVHACAFVSGRNIRQAVCGFDLK